MNRRAGRNGKIVTFYSFKGGTGRTMALANVAWILAASGRRVLAVDWDLESPGLSRFYHPFLEQVLIEDTPGVVDLIRSYQWAAAGERAERSPDWYSALADVSQHTVSLDWNFPDGGVLHFMPAGRQNPDYSATLTSLNWDELYEVYDGGLFFDAMREVLRDEYDFILIDSRTGLSDIAQICTIQMPDVLVALFTLSDQGIDGISQITGLISERYAQRGIRILPVPTRIDEAEKEKAESGRAYARNRLASLPQDMDEAQRDRYWSDVEVPYRPFYAYEETLAVVGDRAEDEHRSLRAAFERLARQIAQDPGVSAPVFEEAVRQRLVAAFARRRNPPPSEFVLCYVSEDQLWADWIAKLLERQGVQPVQYDVERASESLEITQAAASGRTLALVSPAFARSRAATSFARQIAKKDPARSQNRLTAVYVSETRVLDPFAGRPSIDLAGLSEPSAIGVLLGALDLATAGVVGANPRYPGSQPQIWNVGHRNANFTGRGSVLETLRGQLTAKGSAVVLPVALHGLGGVGKTQVALEYAHRFKSDYDLVWWINAEVPDFINTSLAELAGRLGARVGESLPDAARDALEYLRLGNAPHQRWLLIYDNAHDPGELRDFIPDGPGHVLITSRNQSWSAVADALEVDVFTQAESIEHLSKRLPALAAEDAERLAVRLDNLPMAVEVAAAWLAETGTPIEDYLNDLDAGSTRLLSINPPPGYSQTLEATWQISLDRLAERNEAGVRLLELCAFMAPSISVDLVYNQQTLEALAPFDPNLRVPGILGRVIQEISRLALAKIDLQNGEIQVHRLMQDFLRNRLTQDEREERQHVVHRILAGARPVRGDTDDPNNWPQYAHIWLHLEPSQAAGCFEDPVRNLLIDWVRFLWKSSQYEQALELGQRLDAAWSTTLDPAAGPTPAPDSGKVLLRQLFYLRFHLGCVYRSQGNFEKAREVNAQVLEDQLEVLGEDDLHTLITATGLAGDLRGLGRYREALEMDRRTHERLKVLFGEDHERTLLAASNLAVSLRLNGESVEALELDADTLDRRRQVLGAKHPYTLQSVLALARDHRELGDYRQSLSLLESSYQDALEVLGPNFVDTLRTATALAISMRYLGQHENARILTEETAMRFQTDYKPDHPDALACQVNLAADLAATEGPGRALAVAEQALSAYEQQVGEHHPYTCVARTNYGSYLLRTGNVEAALKHLQAAHDDVMATLGESSPLSPGTGINLANAYAAIGGHEKALELDRALQQQLMRHEGKLHPVTLTCSMNLALDLEALNRHEQAAALRAETLPKLCDALGEEHPTVLAARAGTRLDRELVPQPI